ncbi:unnamed protein product [Parajaminaea phylloscopi]
MTHPEQHASQRQKDGQFQKLVEQERIIQSAAMRPEDVPSCMSLFDMWATCFALVPQFRNVYRYGTFNECTPKLEDFKFCLTLKGMDAAQKREAIIERKVRQMARRRMPGGDTSEEIWQIREDPLIHPACVDRAFLPNSQSAANNEQTSSRAV